MTVLRGRIIKTAAAVTLAGVLCTIPLVTARYNTINNNAVNNNAVSGQVSEAYAADDGINSKNAETAACEGDTQAVFSTKDLGIDAANFTQDKQLAKTVDEISNADVNDIVNAQFELIPLEQLNIAEDTSSEHEVMGGKKKHVDNGSLEKMSASNYTEMPMYVYGVDVSKWQGDINWQAAKAAGISFAMIKCAGRSTALDGSLYIDPYFVKNIQEAQAAGIQCGVYFFSQATNVVEAYQEACVTVQLCQQYNITYPVAFDWESESDYRVAYYPQNKLTMNMIAATFCNTVASYGYTPMVYACKSDLYNTYEAGALSASYKIWMANYYEEYHYTNRIYMFERPLPATSFPYQMWQFGVTNAIPGFNGYVDMDLGFFYYMPTIASKFQLSLASNTISTTYGNPVNLLDGVTAVSSAGINAIGYVIYSIVDVNGQLVTEDYAFANVGIYAITYSLTDVDGTTASKQALLYVYPPAGV